MPGSAVSDLAGRVLAGRYLLHGAIGTGASGRVYAAEDTRLRRRVAVKVLHAALAEDTAFLRRFRAEAQLAASLHHPHIVTVHDWGEDDVPFMVLELLVGGSLRSMLDDGTRLSLAQTARVGRDVAAALEYAHARGVMHRDIKPANLLFDEHGIVRVADFGLARALAEASWTEPAGAVFGTARYASPEQARGVQLDARSDLYSLSLVIVEAVTGRVPFTADTTIGMLTARTLESLSAPEEMGPLADVVNRAGALEPDDRFSNAESMRSALQDVADVLPPPSPLPLAGMIDRIDPNPTRTVEAHPSSPPSAPLFDQDAIEVIVAPPIQPKIVPPSRAELRKQKRAERRATGQHRLVPWVVLVVLLVTVAIAFAALARVSGAAPLPVPSFVGLTQQQATNAAVAKGLSVSVGANRAAPDPAGTVIDQAPKGGAFSGSHHITLVLSKGPPRVAIPSSTNQAWTAFEGALLAAGIDYKKKDVYDDNVVKGMVIGVQPPTGTLVTPDSAKSNVVVSVSNGHSPVNVPDVRDQSYSDASAAITAAGFTVKRAPDEFSSSVDKGNVIRTVPPHDQMAPFGSEITVVVSKGPDLVAVPDVTKLSLDDATKALNHFDFAVAVNGSVRGNQRVVSQDPKKGAKVPRGSTVTLSFAKKCSGLDSILGLC